jgi:hypothetical protein
MKNLQATLDNLVKVGSVNNAFSNFAPVESFSSKAVFETSQDNSSSSSNTAIIIAIVLGSTLLIGIIVITTVCVLRKGPTI